MQKPSDSSKPDQSQPTSKETLRKRLHEIIFEADTSGGRTFDLVLLFLILFSILVVMLDSVAEYGGPTGRYRLTLLYLEWAMTIIFTLEYLLRIFCVHRPSRYIFSFYGLVDLLAILPTYLLVIGIQGHYAAVIRALRLLRIFRVLKLGRHLKEGQTFLDALNASKEKLTVFLAAVCTIVLIMGSLMYVVEGGKNEAFSDIPKSMYWAVVTVTTVGYGDITPQTDLGQILASVLMLVGYAIIAVPTGLVSAQIYASQRKEVSTSTQVCQQCSFSQHDNDAVYCKRCGFKLY